VDITLELGKIERHLLDSKNRKLLEECWIQLAKDFNLAGISDFPASKPVDLNALISILIEFITSPKNKTTNWDSVNYRVDIPSEIDCSMLSSENYARLLFIRVFQKVWFRHQYQSFDRNGQIHE
jgi:hypothetical protein